MLQLKLPEYLEPPIYKREAAAFCEAGCQEAEIFSGDEVFIDLREASGQVKPCYCYGCIVEATGLGEKNFTELNGLMPHIIQVLDFFEVKYQEFP